MYNNNGRRRPATAAKLRREIGAAKAALKAAGNNVAKKKAPQNQNYTRPWRQGVAMVTKKPFGFKKKGALRHYFNANSPCHLPLPRAIGGYAVVRSTQLISFTENVGIFGPMRIGDNAGGETMRWSNVCCLASVDPSLAMNATTNTSPYIFTALGSTAGAVVAGWENVTLVPAAFTLQIMNPAALTASGGIARIGRLRTLPELTNNARTWTAFANQFTSYAAPRLCSGGKLALRGVTVSALPYEMNALADFSPLETVTDANFTWNGAATLNSTSHYDGFAPIVIAQNNFPGPLEVLVTCEWRVRFDPSNPAMASHTLHQPASESLWAKAIAEADSLGHGVVDIVEEIADRGAADSGSALGLG